MDELTIQLADDRSDIVFLKESNRGNASGTRLMTCMSVLERYASQRENRNFMPANFPQAVESSQTNLRSVILFKNRGEDGEITALRGGLRNLRAGMTRDADSCMGRLCCLRPNFAHLRWRNVIGPQVRPVSAASYGYIGPRVDQQASGGFLVLRSQGMNFMECRKSKPLEFACGKIFLAQLNQVDAATGCLCDLREQGLSAAILIPRKLGAISNVAKQQAYGFVFAISGSRSTSETRSPLRFGSELR